MRGGRRAWVWAWVWWVWLNLSSFAHAHSIHTDPHFNPDHYQHGGGRGCVEGELSNHLAIEIQGGEDEARHLALKHNLHYVRQVFTDPPVFHLHKPLDSSSSSSSRGRCSGPGSREGSSRRGRKKRSPQPHLVYQLSREPGVRWVDQQRAYVRDKRDHRPLHIPSTHLHSSTTHRHTSATHHHIPAEIQRNRAVLDNILRKRHGGSDLGGRRERLEEEEEERIMEDWSREEGIGMVGEYAEGAEGRLKKEIKEDEGRYAEYRKKDSGDTEGKGMSILHFPHPKEGPGMKQDTPQEEKEGHLSSPGHGHLSQVLLRNHTEASLLRSLQTSLGRHQHTQDPQHSQDPPPHVQIRRHFPPDADTPSADYSRRRSDLQDPRSVQIRRHFPPDADTPPADNSRRRSDHQGESACRRDKNQVILAPPGVHKKGVESPSRERESPPGSQDPGSEVEEGAATSGTTTADDHAGLPDDLLLRPKLEFNDPLYKDQWYMVNTGQLGREGWDLNLTWPWSQGYTGKGVTVSILDDGIQTTNADLADNYVSEVSYSVVKDSQSLDDPSPRLDPPAYTNSHGTYCSGIVAAVANNSICGVGVAFQARVGGVRIVDGTVTDIQEATALSRHADTVDVFSASWGPPDDGTRVEGPGKLARQALLYGITKGREGRGVVYVWAAGNGGLVGDNCNLDGYTSSIYTLSMSAITDTGTSTFYEERCASTLAAVFVGGSHTLEAAKESKLNHVKQLRMVVPELDGHCSEKFQGSSAAAPLMAGVVALALQANPQLTWRDVQHLVVATTAPTPQALLEDGWDTNTCGRRFHLLQGFGAVNAGRMVEAALTWKNVAPQRATNVTLLSGSRPLRPKQWGNVTGSLGDVGITSVEHVVASISINHQDRNMLEIFIVSPGGTHSQVLTQRPLDVNGAGFRSWGFMSVHFWGEDPRGTWRVSVANGSNRSGYLKEMRLEVFGT